MASGVFRSDLAFLCARVPAAVRRRRPAPDTVSVSNNGGKPLVLQSIALGGTGAGASKFTLANAGFSNCNVGIEIAAHSFCYIGVVVASGAPVPSSATLRILSNDPVHPETDLALTLTQ